MKTKEEFKIFINSHPSFAKSVEEGKTTWQKLFELYNLYDENSNVWDKYLDKKIDNEKSNFSLNSITSLIKSINLESFQNNLNNIQKAVSLIEEFTRKDEKSEVKKEYKDNDIERFYRD